MSFVAEDYGKGGPRMTNCRLANAGPVIAARNVDGKDGNHSGIVTRCPCGGKLDRAGMDLLYCDRCGAEFLARQLRRPHTFHLTRVPV